MNEKIKNYPSTEKFRIKDTIGVPHTYCVGPKHVVWASDHWGGMLGDSAIKDGESKGKCHCEVKGCTLSYEEHEQALLVAVKDERQLNDIPELKEYLLSIKDQREKDGFAGFAFIQDK